MSEETGTEELEEEDSDESAEKDNSDNGELEEDADSDESEDTEYESIESDDEELSIENLLKSDEEDEEDEDSGYEDMNDMYPEELIDIELECIYIGLLFNNPKAISRYYLLYDDCRFSNKELNNLYRIIIFRDGESYHLVQPTGCADNDNYQKSRQ